MEKEYLITYKSIFDSSEKRAIKFFMDNKDLFIYSSLSSEDLVQEIFLTLILTIEKYKDKKPIGELNRLCNNAVGWRLNKFYGKISKDYNLDKIKSRFEKKLLCKGNLVKFVEFNDKTFETSNYRKSLFNFSELHNVLDEKEYDIVFCITQKEKSAKQLGIKYSRSHVWVRDIYLKALKKIKKYLLEKSKLGI